MPEEPKEPNIWEVVAQNQRQIAGLEKNQATVTSTLSQILQGFKELHIEVSSLREQVVTSGKPKISVWIASGALILAVLGGFSGLVAWGYGINISHLTDTTSETHASLQKHISDGHPPRVIERIDGMKDFIDRFILRSDEADKRIEEDTNGRINRLEQDLKDGLYNGIR